MKDKEFVKIHFHGQTQFMKYFLAILGTAGLLFNVYFLFLHITNVIRFRSIKERLLSEGVLSSERIEISSNFSFDFIAILIIGILFSIWIIFIARKNFQK